MDDRLALGIHDLICAARSYHSAEALVTELARLYIAAGEPLPWLLREFTPDPAEYVQTRSTDGSL